MGAEAQALPISHGTLGDIQGESLLVEGDWRILIAPVSLPLAASLLNVKYS